MALRFPRKSSRKNPTTVGGRTSGRVITASATVPARRLRICSTPYASAMPTKKVITVASPATSRDMMSGESVSSVITSQ